MKKYTLAKKDHNHFTNECCVCKNKHDDSAMVPIWVNRLSGVYPKHYLEPDYACIMCLIKTQLTEIEIDNKLQRAKDACNN